MALCLKTFDFLEIPFVLNIHDMNITTWTLVTISAFFVSLFFDYILCSRASSVTLYFQSCQRRLKSCNINSVSTDIFDITAFQVSTDPLGSACDAVLNHDGETPEI